MPYCASPSHNLPNVLNDTRQDARQLPRVTLGLFGNRAGSAAANAAEPACPGAAGAWPGGAPRPKEGQRGRKSFLEYTTKEMTCVLFLPSTSPYFFCAAMTTTTRAPMMIRPVMPHCGPFFSF